MRRGQHQNRLIICPNCNKEGFLSRRLVGSASYYVLYATCHQFVEGINPDFLRQYKYTGNNFVYKDYYRRYEYEFIHPRTGESYTCYLQTDIGNNDKPLRMLQEVLSDRRRIRYYVGHYDPEKFKKQMERYREGKIKTRPNGRKWCLLKDGTKVQQGEVIRSLGEFYGRPNLNDYHYDDHVYYDGHIICDN